MNEHMWTKTVMFLDAICLMFINAYIYISFGSSGDVNNEWSLGPYRFQTQPEHRRASSLSEWDEASVDSSRHDVAAAPIARHHGVGQSGARFPPQGLRYHQRWRTPGKSFDLTV